MWGRQTGKDAWEVEPQNLVPPSGSGWQLEQFEGMGGPLGEEAGASVQVSPCTQLPWRMDWARSVLPPPGSIPIPHCLFLPTIHLCPSSADTGRATRSFIETHQMEPRLHWPRTLGSQEASACVPGTSPLASWPLRPGALQGTGAGERSPCRSLLLTVSEPTPPRGP